MIKLSERIIVESPNYNNITIFIAYKIHNDVFIIKFNQYFLGYIFMKLNWFVYLIE